MTVLFSNDAATTLAGGISNVATSALLAAGSGILFPNPTNGDYFILTFTDEATGQLHEIVHVTARAGDVITLLRGREGTAAKAWVAGDLVDHMCTAGSMAAMVQISNALSSAGAYAIEVPISPNDASAVFANPPQTIAGYDGALLRLRRPPTNSNTGAMTMTVNTIQNGNQQRSLVNAGGAPMLNGQLVGPCIYTCIYDAISDVFRMQSVTLPLDLSETVGNLPVTRITGIFQPLVADVTYYINASTGNDSNAGSLSQPWLTLQKAIDTIASVIDLAGHNITINCTGAFTAGAGSNVPWRGGSAANITFAFQGGSQVIATADSCFKAFAPGCGMSIMTISGALVILTATGTGVNQGSALAATLGSQIIIASPVNFGACAVYHMRADLGGLISVRPLSYQITGSAQYHLYSSVDGRIIFDRSSGGTAVAITGSPSMSGAYAGCYTKSLLMVPSTYVTYSGSLTGKRFDVTDASLIQTIGGGTGFFPGSIAGTPANAFNYA